MDQIMTNVITVMYNGITKTYSERMRKIETEVRKSHSKVFKTMAMKAIDVKSAPNLGQHTPEWTALSNTYRNKKIAQGRSGNFYSNTGALKGALASLDANTILGTPLVSLGGVGQQIVKREETWKNSSGTKRIVIRNLKGQFVAERTLRENLPKGITVTPFPKITQEAMRGILDEEEFLPLEISQKLKNPKGKRLRPIFTNYINWYIDVEIRKAVSRGMTK